MWVSDDKLRGTVEDLLSTGGETRRFEVKGPGRTDDKHHVARVARAAMAMGNLRDGGLVCVGIADTLVAAMLPGLDEEELAQWSDGDTVADRIASHSDPPVTLTVRPLVLSNGARVAVLVVDEFDDNVHVCKKDMSGVLQAGQTYVRPRGKPRSAQVPSVAEMRELHDLAIEKGVREFVRRAAAAGLLGTASSSESPTSEDLDQAAFNSEADLAWADPTPVTTPEANVLVPHVATAAYFDVSVRPGPYRADRVRSDSLESFITQHAVSLRGWPVPMVGGRERVRRMNGWIRQDMQSVVVPHAEAWRLFASGQFLQRRIVATDVEPAPHLRPRMPGATGAIAIWDLLLYLVEVAELAARIGTAIEADEVTFNVALRNVAGRELISGEAQRRSNGPYFTDAESISANVRFSLTDLIAGPRQRGVDLAQSLLREFGTDIADDVLLDWQAQILEEH